jgi:hypothetical protein
VKNVEFWPTSTADCENASMMPPMAAMPAAKLKA